MISLAHLAASDLDGETDLCSIFSQSLVRNSLVATLVLGLIAFLAVKQATKGRQAAQPADSPQVPRLIMLCCVERMRVLLECASHADVARASSG